VIVVTDTSVILNLSLLGLQDLLPVIFGEIHAPPIVRSEFLRLVAEDPRFDALEFPDYIHITPVAAIHSVFMTPRLHQGEREALSLAVEMKATRILMDERAGRTAAASMGITAIGLLGILIQARRLNFIDHLAPYLDRLQSDARFWFSPALRMQVLQLAGELP
jgi:uncharacterized protein